MKYSKPLCAFTFIGPLRYECTSSRDYLALYTFLIKYFLVFFFSRQDLHGGNESFSNSLRSPFLTTPDLIDINMT